VCVTLGVFGLKFGVFRWFSAEHFIAGVRTKKEICSMRTRIASSADGAVVANFIEQLLFELEPEASKEIASMPIRETTSQLLENNKIVAILAYSDERVVGVITLCECAAIYANGLFGEISELYVLPEYRSGGFGNYLLEAACKFAQSAGWSRLQLGTPALDKSVRAISFYHQNGFKGKGLRLSRQII
jgi:ribosomal protein S18 acetylase RimI-like enzyme